MEAYRTAYVYIGDLFAGTLREVDDGYTFSYDREYLDNLDATPVSVTMPLRKESYQSNALFSFFDGLIPEGWMLNIVSRNWKVDVDDRFGLLLVACKDCIGNVSIYSEKI